jgi:hypothetical protein
MSEEKNIDRLFQEKLKDFEVAPRDVVWNDIEARLNHKKKKRRVIPLWLRLSSAAAVLILMIALTNSIFFKDKEALPSENTIVNDNTLPNQDPQKLNGEELESSEETKIINTDVVKGSNAVQEAIAKNDVNTKKKNSSSNRLKNEINVILDDQNNDKAIALNKTATKSDPLIANIDAVSKQGVQSEENIKETEKPISKEKEEKSILEEIINAEEAIANNDKPSKDKRWSISSSVAPVYFNTLGEGSSIHRDFNSNPKSGDVNMSYGLTASYAVNDKISIRSGINKVNLGYSTNDIVVFNDLSSSIRSSGFQNISLNGEAIDVSFLSPSSFSAEIPRTLVQKNTSIDQQLGFIEVPLELEYTLIDKKFGFHVIGGFSALFLDSNDIYSVVDGQSTLIGEATNINKTSYSANLGLGLNYKMSQKFNLNLEPVFKYQINTFTNTSGDFRPYFIGFYSGVSFKF